MSKKRLIIGITGAVFQLSLIGLAILAVIHRQDIIDWWRLQNYHPQADVIQLADDDTMIGRGRNLFYVSKPEIDDRNQFNQTCVGTGEKSLVLGCYRAQRIYVFNVTDRQLNGVKEVTSAHEMLHAAYERLSTSEKNRVNAMLDPIIKNMTDQRILGLIQLYNAQEPGELYNEMHSVLATEYRNLSPELEQYYKQYFADRGKIVSYSERYEAVFSASKARIADMDAKLTSLKSQIDSANHELAAQDQALNQAATQLNQLRAANNVEAYNAGVPPYNNLVREFNALVASTRALISEYNSLVDQRNKEAAAQNGLYQSLNSRYQPMSQN